MKRLGLIFSMVFLFCVGNVLANTNPRSTKKLTHQISKMLMKEAINLNSEGSVAEVRLMVDSFGRIQVLSIDTSDEILEKFLMERIDKNTVQQGSYQLGVVYRVPVEIAG